MSSNSSTTNPVINLLLFDTDPQPLAASVISANPTATAYLIGCPPDTDSDACGTFNETVTVGPWAAASPPASASTGVYDMNVQLADDGISISIHCAMAHTVPATCTFNDAVPDMSTTVSPVVTSPASDDLSLGWAYMPVTVTAGQEKLGGSTSAGPSLTAGAASASGPRSTGAAAASAIGTSAASSGSAGASSASMSVSAASSSASASASKSGASGLAPSGVGSVALAGMLLAWLLR